MLRTVVWLALGLSTSPHGTTPVIVRGHTQTGQKGNKLWRLRAHMREKKAINSGGAAGAHTGYKRQQMTDNGGCGRTHGTIQKATNVLIVEAAGAHTGYKRQQMC
eukprot:1195455-Prorocentrum_minimum.AAC.5